MGEGIPVTRVTQVSHTRTVKAPCTADEWDDIVYGPEEPKAKRVQCLICQHPDRETIEAEALAGSVRAVGRKWGLCPTSVSYHMEMH